MDALTKLRRARCQLLSTKPFYGELALYLEPVLSTIVPTTATDGKRLYYNPEFVLKHTDADVMFLVEHEVWHCIQGAFDRRPKGCHLGILNLAQDFVINTIIHDEGITKSDLLTQVCGTDVQKMARNKTSEEVYFELMKNKPKCDACDQGVPFPQPSKGNEGDSGGGSGEEGESEEKGGSGDKQEGQGQGQGQGGGTPKHTCHGQCVSGTLTDESSETEGMTQAEKSEWQQRVINSAQSALAKGQGDVPGSIQEMLNELFNPTVNWKDYVLLNSQKAFKERYTWRKPSRRQGQLPLRMISREPTNKGGVITLDTSGSISDDWIRQFMTEAVEIMRICHAPWIDIYLHDVVCYKKYRVKVGSNEKWEVSRGGTCHIDVFNKIEESEEKPGLIICMTDLYTSFPPEAPDCPVIWAHPKDQGNEVDVPFGTKIEVDLDK